jgi:hypothetical protein
MLRLHWADNIFTNLWICLFTLIYFTSVVMRYCPFSLSLVIMTGLPEFSILGFFFSNFFSSLTPYKGFMWGVTSVLSSLSTVLCTALFQGLPIGSYSDYGRHHAVTNWYLLCLCGYRSKQKGYRLICFYSKPYKLHCFREKTNIFFKVCPCYA